MELLTKSPYGDPPHVVIARACGENRCRATTPCLQHEQVIIRLCVDGYDKPEFKLSKQAFEQFETLHRDKRELFHMLAELAVLADGTPEILAGQPGMTGFMNG